MMGSINIAVPTMMTSLRADVDSSEDLRFCLQLGAGLLTAQMLPDLV